MLEVLRDPKISHYVRQGLAHLALEKDKGDKQAIRYILQSGKSRENLTGLLLLANLYPENPLPTQLLVAAIEEFLAKKDFESLDKLKTQAWGDWRLKIPLAVYDRLEKMIDLADENTREYLRDHFAAGREEKVMKSQIYRRALCRSAF